MIDPRAIVHPGAQLAADVSVGPFSVIGSTSPSARACRSGRTWSSTAIPRMGADNKVSPFASIGGPPQDKKYAGEPTRLEIGDRNVFREGCTVNRGTTHDKGVTRIGDDNLLMAYAHIAHDCIIGNKTIFANCASLGGHVEVGDWVIIGGLTAIHQFVKIGAHAFLGGDSALTRDMPPYVMAAGNPTVPHTVNSEGLKRRGFSPEQIRNIKNAYRILYRSDLKLAEAIARLEPLAAEQPELRPFVEFIQDSSRSLVR